MNYLRSDCLLSEILEEKKSLSGFLDTIFGFLSRRTDFYHVQKNKDETKGFPRGIKEEILMSCMQKYEIDHNLKEEYDVPPPALEEVEIETAYSELTLGEEPANNGMLETSNSNKVTKGRVVFCENDYRNGAVVDALYCWSQTLNDVELSVILPKEVKSGKHVKLDLKSKYISVKSLLPHEQVLVCGETWDKYKHNDVVWTIADGKIILSFDKSKEAWWEKLFVHEDAINVKKLDTDRPIEEYSDETQRAIEKIQIEEMTNKEIGDLKTLPMSKSEQLCRLKQAWNAEDSPFKGKPFDPSVLQFN